MTTQFLHSFRRFLGIQNVNLIRVGQVIYLTAATSAVNKLAALDYWQQAAASGKVKYLDLLLTKAARKITKAGIRTATPEEGVALGFFVAFAAMLGYDKLRQMLEQVTRMEQRKE